VTRDLERGVSRGKGDGQPRVKKKKMMIGLPWRLVWHWHVCRIATLVRIFTSVGTCAELPSFCFFFFLIAGFFLKTNGN
jgi:hypothetical protein